MKKDDVQSQLESVKKLRNSLSLLSSPHRLEYKRWINSLEKRIKQKQPVDKSLEKLSRQLSKAAELIKHKLSNVPKIHFPELLPISKHVDELTKAIKENQVIIVAGETGSGKTTQLPKICLAMGRGIHGQIGHTQPRRLAARNVALRIAEELGVTLGNEVGYQVRFEDKSDAAGYIKLMTDGILLNELHHDPLLKKYDTIIIDEAHERSLNIDFILGILHQVLSKRPDLKVIITSATIDPERFSNHFNKAPVIEVSGRTYPVETLYMPLNEFNDEDGGLSTEEGVCQAAELLGSAGKGDILVFLPGEQDIRHVADYLRRHVSKGYEILPLYSRLAQADQMKIFSTSSRSSTRIILSTNVAETSLTVPGIHYVIDSGKARMSRYSVRSKIQRLPIEAISQASANQRQGRCGRIANGISVRLYSEEDFLGRDEFTEPEIKRTNLASVILQMATLELGSVEDFHFIEPPDARLINDGYKLLQELGAMTVSREITALGKQLAILPVDPKIGRILLAGSDNKALEEILIITAAMSLPDPRERPVEKQQQADEKHSRFTDKDSDFIAILNLWNYFSELKLESSWNQLRKVCQREFINFNRLREWREIYGQLKRLMHETKYPLNKQPADYDAIHKSLLTGLISQIGEKSSDGDYQATRNNRFHLFPGSGLFQKKSKKSIKDDDDEKSRDKARSSKWLLAGELVETQRLYARQVAKIDPTWVEQLAPHLLKHQYSDPYWSRKSARAMVKESVTLYGLTIIANRPVALAIEDAEKAHELFIFHALVENDFVTRASAIIHNRKCLEQVEAMEHRARRRDILVEQDYLESFYSVKVPIKIHNGPAFEKWYKSASPAEQKILELNVEDLIREEAEEIDRYAYPETLFIKGITLELEYHFEPGAEDDGLHIIMPIAYINQFTEEDFHWLVPGMLEIKIIALLRGLPKALRKNFVPVPDYAKSLLDKLHPDGEVLTQQMASTLRQMTSVLIQQSDFNQISLEENLKPLFYLTDMDSGAVIAFSRNFSELQKDHALSALDHLQSNTTTTLFENFPTEGFEKKSTTEHGTSSIEIYSGLSLVDDQISIKAFDNEQQANEDTKNGLKLLLIKNCAKKIKTMKRLLPELTKAEFSYSTLRKSDIENTHKSFFDQQISELYLDLFLLICENEIGDKACDYNSEKAFENLTNKISQTLLPEIVENTNLLIEIFRQAEKVRKAISKISSPSLISLATIIQERLESLMYTGFLSNVGWEQLHHYPRYLKALAIRFERADLNPQQERERSVIWNNWWQKYHGLTQAKSGTKVKSKESITEIRWLLEEFHVSLFAQQLGTKKSVSEKRLEKYFS
ncbi:MAG: ATP-dependent RNA helicase HrpA [Gammaproteobacteria bacterium]|nr:MAG: ATP-dependent RNA helicase HrpA [Gammaproteobacteria bacterium]